MSDSSEFSLENKVFCRFFMQEKWPPTMRKFRVFIAAISDLVCVCLCLGQAGWFSKCTWLFPFELGWCNKSWEDSAFFVAAIASLCVCATRRDRSRVKIPHFCCGYFWLVCVCVCVCVYMCYDTWCNSRVKVPCFHCSYFQLMCVFVCSALCLDWAGPALRCSSIAGISESETECVLCCQLPHFATLIFRYS